MPDLEEAPESNETHAAFNIAKLPPQAGIQYLSHAGLIGADDITPLAMSKRINHAAFANEHIGDIPALQSAFVQTLIQAGDVAKMAEGGANSPAMQLVTGYLREREKHYDKLAREMNAIPQELLGTAEFTHIQGKAVKKAAQYKGERESYEAMPELVNDTVRNHPEILSSGKYLPIGQLAITTGLVKGDPVKMADAIDDVLANAAAHNLLHTASGVLSVDDEDLRRWREFSKRYATNIHAKAEGVADSTTPLQRAELMSDATEGLAQIQALKALLSAHLNALTSHTRNVDGTSSPGEEQLAENLAKIKPLVRDYQSAGMSLAFHFLGEGPGADDARMQTMREHLEEMAEIAKVPLLMNASEARAKTAELVAKSAGFLREKFAGNASAINTLDMLVTAASGKNRETGFSERVSAPTANYAEQIASRGAAIALAR